MGINEIEESNDYGEEEDSYEEDCEDERVEMGSNEMEESQDYKEVDRSQLLGGILTPRMFFRLKTTAEVAGDVS